ncbi:ncalda, partial [Symbiodinium sp. KB8]
MAINLVDQLFDLFDANHDGVVDMSEAAMGVSVLTGGSGEEKVWTAFSILDQNGDGFISKDEMLFYLTSVFKVMRETDETIAARMDREGVTPDILAESTTAMCFREADTDADNRLSYTEFSKWYQTGALPGMGHSTTLQGRIQERTREVVEAAANRPPERVVLQDLQQSLALDKISLGGLLEVFGGGVNSQSQISRKFYDRCFRALTSSLVASAYRSKTKRFQNLLWNLFSTSESTAEWPLMACALVALAPATVEEKSKTLIRLFDYHNRGGIGLPQLETYMVAVFRVLFLVNPSRAKKLAVSPDELAVATAHQAFDEADLSHRGQLKLEEFLVWYRQSFGSTEIHTDGSHHDNLIEHVMDEAETDGSNPMSLNDIKRLTTLEQHNVTDVAM